MASMLTTKQISSKFKGNVDHFILNRWILIGAGLWVPKTNSKTVRVLFKFYTMFVIIILNILYTIAEFVSIKDTYSNLYSLIKNLSFALTHLLGILKGCFWHYRNKELKRLIKILQKNEFCYDNTDCFKPEDIFKDAKKTGIKYTFTFFAMAHLTVFSSYIPAFVTAFSDKYGNVTFYHLPYYSWVPFTWTTPSSYFAALCYEFIPVYCFIYTITGIDTLFMNMVNLIGAHITVLKGAFQTIGIRSRTKLQMLGTDSLYTSHEKKQLDYLMMEEFKISSSHLQTIFMVCKDLENIHGCLTLLQVLFTLFIFCTCLFLVSSTPVTSKRFISEIIYMVAMGFQLVLYCWFGNEVALKASEIPDELWKSDWLDTSFSYRSNMLITMIRMRRPLYFTAGKFAPLTLVTFVSILRRSYSLFAVLKRVDDSISVSISHEVTKVA